MLLMRWRSQADSAYSTYFMAEVVLSLLPVVETIFAIRLKDMGCFTLSASFFIIIFRPKVFVMAFLAAISPKYIF